jgi:orotidine-5'-phosphate decarboxylase
MGTMTDERPAEPGRVPLAETGPAQPPPGEARDHLALALDVGDLDEAIAMWRRLRENFSVAKVGLELFSAAGPSAIEAFRAEEAIVFVDLKLHDIPNTVFRAARTIASAGAFFVTAHTAGGAEMVSAAAAGFVEGRGRDGDDSQTAGFAAGVLGVTVLTSAADAPAAALRERAGLAARCGCTGLVCAPVDLGEVAEAAPRLLRVTPGVRLAGASKDDQARATTPSEALRRGADLLVIGRTVTASKSPEMAAAAVVEEVQGVLSSW